MPGHYKINPCNSGGSGNGTGGSPGSVAIMQPYLFPYIGYFHLVEASDTFVFYDDVNYIKSGWINRNRVLINGKPYRFTVPVTNGSQNEIIGNVRMHSLQEFRRRFLKQIRNAYGKAPFYEAGIGYIEKVLDSDSDLIADIAIRSIEEFYKIIKLPRSFLRSSDSFAETRGTSGADRLIEITRVLGYRNYVNAMGGVDLYDKEYFREKNVCLSFIKPVLRKYPQTGQGKFVDGLSIIDVVMHADRKDILEQLSSYCYV